tara:strand:+ start:804 stop:1076 length:273 start_codon:yes stop_codon:yes gene_type:complete
MSYFYLRKTLINRPCGKLKGAVVVFRNITGRNKNKKRHEEAYKEIKILKDLLEHARDYLRDEINAIINFGEIIGENQARLHNIHLHRLKR